AARRLPQLPSRPHERGRRADRHLRPRGRPDAGRPVPPVRAGEPPRPRTEPIHTSREPREEPAMKLAYTTLFVPDIEQALAFYETAFGLRRRFVHESGQYAELETGTTALA